jgi:hypothetical protein
LMEVTGRFVPGGVGVLAGPAAVELESERLAQRTSVPR